MIKPVLWDGESLTGEWLATIKVDGVRAKRTDSGVVSRSGKPLYNLDHLNFTEAEIYLGSWEDTVSAVRTMEGSPVPKEAVYELDPVDDRLHLGELVDPSKETILSLMEAVLSIGYEGLVLRSESKWLKIKPQETYDVPVTGIQEGRGKNLGKMGALLTPMGKVGTGFTDEQRRDMLNLELGTVIEVECMSLTPSGKFRHARFKRLRFDK